MSETVKEFLESFQAGKRPVKNEYDHGQLLLEPEKIGKASSFNLIDAPIILANISNDELLSIYQSDAELLVQAYSMSEREKKLKGMFEILYAGWRSKIIMTKTKDGSERKLQASISGRQRIEKTNGFGRDLDYEVYEEPEDNKRNPSFLDKLLKRR